MAPVDPTDLLKAFKPLLTTLGGIKSKSEVPRLSMLMKKYSKKLVSRCIYCNILHATTPDLLQTFLEQDGWNLINAWIKDSLNGNNFPFLCELLDLLDKCPMTVERLKTNDTPKLIKNLAKSSDKDVSAKARIVVTKWTGLVHKTNENINNGNLNRKKRKKEKSIDDEESDSTKLRKIKGGAVLQQQASVDDTAVTSSSTGDTAYKPTSNTRPRTGEDVTSNDGDNTGSKTEKRPSTAKISYGKARSLGILEDINAGPGKSKSSNKKGDDPQSTSDKSGHGNKNNKLNSKSVDNSVSVSSSGQPTQAKPVATKPIHTLKESVGFIEDIANISSFTGRVRKRRKSDSKTKSATTTGITATKDTGQAENSNNGDEPGTGQDPMDIEDSDEMDEERAASAASAVSGDDSNSNAGNSNNNNNNFNNNNENSNSNNNDDNALPFVDVPEIDNLVIPEIDASKLSGAIKSILNYGRQSGKSKKSVKWRAEDRLREIRYFELDETERTNVTKQGNFGDFRSIDIKNERQMMQQLRNKGNTPAAPVPSGSAAATPSAEKMVTYLPWRLLPIDLPQGLPLIEAGCQSEERRVQAEAARNCFNSDFFPVKEMEYGFPKEPDLLEPSINNDGPRTIPLEDENLTVTDYSQLPPPQPRTGESYPANRGVPPGPGPGPGLGGLSAPVPGPYPISGMAPRPPAGYIPRPPHPPAGFVPPVSGYAPYGGGPYTPPVQQAPPRMVPPRPGPPPGFQPPGGAWPPRPRPPPICRNFLKTGNCRFMARCNYLHQYPNNPHGSTPASSSSQPHME